MNEIINAKSCSNWYRARQMRVNAIKLSHIYGPKGRLKGWPPWQAPNFTLSTSRMATPDSMHANLLHRGQKPAFPRT